MYINKLWMHGRYGQGVGDIIEWMAVLDPAKYTEQYGWMDPDFLMTLMLENYTVTNNPYSLSLT